MYDEDDNSMAMGLGLAGLVFGPVVIFFCWRYHTTKQDEIAEANTAARKSPNNHESNSTVSHDNCNNAGAESLQPLRKLGQISFSKIL